MMEIDVIPMPYGDCFILTWTEADGTPRLVVLDSGTASAYRKSIRQKLRDADRDIDLWVISHPHRDHIGGALKYVRDINMPSCHLWGLNGYYPPVSDASAPVVNDATVATSAADGRRLNDSIYASGTPVRGMTAGDTLHVGDVLIRVLSPRPEDIIPNIADEAGDGTVATASGADDYATPVDDFNLDYFEEDAHPMNRASIALLIEYRDSRFLWLADSVPSVVCPSIRQLGYTTQHPLVCDYVSLAHHGSRGNTSSELVSLVCTHNYIVTANACNKHNLPHKETLSRLIRAPRPKHHRLALLFPTDEVSPLRIFAADGPDIFTRRTFTIRTGATRIMLDA